MRKTLLFGMLAMAGISQAQLAISIGIRETGSTGPIGSNGGTSNGIEFVNVDGQTLVMDGTWQTFTFTFQTDPLTAFAGTTANNLYDGTRGVLEHIRIRNTGGVTSPITIWLDDITNTTAAGGPTNFGAFEGYGDNQEVMFQEPSFSGSTVANLVAGSTAGVDNAVAFSGTGSYRANFQFVDATDTRWVRWTTFGTATLPNPIIDFAPGSTLTFKMRTEAIPEPATMAALGLGAATLLRRRRKA